MIDLLEPLTRLRGVRFVALVTEDGVPIPVPCEGSGGPDEADRYAAVARQFLSELVQSVAPLTWGPPVFARVGSDRGGVALQRVRGGALMVVHGPEGDPGALRLPMRAAAERIERTLDRFGSRNTPSEAIDAVPAPLRYPSARGEESHVHSDTSENRENE
ncbi:MAG: roadblock/LC7 domain-containing protein [Planctomycetota bacterium]